MNPSPDDWLSLMDRHCVCYYVVVCLTALAIGLFIDLHSARAAPTIEIASSPNPVGSGARALGMGGAFIAIADDATAASWNPGGLIQLERPEISAVGAYTARTENISFETNPEADGRNPIENYDLNYLSVAYPFTLNYRNMIVSINYQHLYDFERRWAFEMDINPILHLDMDYAQTGALYALGLAYAVEVVPDFSLGVTVNYWGDFLFENKWEQKYDEILSAFGFATPSHYEESFDFKGWNAVFGFLWDATEHWTIGGVIKTGFSADVKHTVSDNGNTKQSNDKMDMPMSYGIGIAYRFSDAFTLSGDFYRTHWEDFAYHAENGASTSPVSGKNLDQSDVDNTSWFRVSAEYLFILRKLTIAARCGLFYDQSPAEDTPEDYYGFALGTGIAYKGFVWDVAYQFRYGNDVGRSLLQGRGFCEDVTEQKVYVSLIVHF